MEWDGSELKKTHYSVWTWDKHWYVIQVSKIDRSRSKVHIANQYPHSFSLLLLCCELLMLCANEMLPQKLRLDPATCTAPNPSEVEDFVMRRQSLELKEVGQMPTKTGEESFFFWFFSESSQVVSFWSMGFSNLNLASTEPGDIEDRGENKGEACFFFPREFSWYLQYPSYLGWIGLKCLCAMLSDVFRESFMLYTTSTWVT